MLFVKGQCLTCHARDVNFVRDGVSKTFKAHRCCLHLPESDFDPIFIDTGEVPLVKGKFYRVPIRVSTYTDKNGSVHVQYQTYKNHPPQELKAPTASA